MNPIEVSVIMGSRSDLPVMNAAVEVLKEFGIAHEVSIVSAHRTPERMVDYAKSAAARGLKIIIAGAGGAAHLPGMVASLTILPVIGVPIHSRNSIDGWDSVLSILQMPGGVPVATVALDGGKNAGLLAVRMLASHSPDLAEKLTAFSEQQRQKVLEHARRVEQGDLSTD